MVLRTAASLIPLWKGVIKPYQPFPVSPMQCKRVVEAVRLFGRCENLCHDEMHPVAAPRINDKSQAVQFKQRIESRIVLLHHACKLSD